MEITPQADPPETDQELWDEVTAADDAAVDASGAADDEPQAEDTTPAADDAAAPGSAPAAEAGTEPQQPEIDPLAGLPEPVRTALAAIPRLEHELRSANGRIGALQREQAQRGAQAPAAPEPAARRPNPKLDALREELPEVAEALDEMLANPGGSQIDAETLRKQALAEVNEQLLDTMRPDWGSAVTSPEFQTWLQAQPDEYRQRIAVTNRAADIVGALKGFDEHVAKAAQAAERTRQLNQTQQRRDQRAASAVTPNGVRRPLAKSEADMTEDELWDAVTR